MTYDDASEDMAVDAATVQQQSPTAFISAGEDQKEIYMSQVAGSLISFTPE